MSFQGFIESQCTRFNGKNLSRKLRGEQNGEKQFPQWGNCHEAGVGEIASLLATEQIDLTTDTIDSDPANSLPDPLPVDRWRSDPAIPDLDPYFGSKRDECAQVGGAL